MKVVSIFNHKGGVGKTTLAANLGAGLALRGKKILLIDFDPQCSLTYSFVTQQEWSKELAKSGTLKEWVSGEAVPLASLILSPRRIGHELSLTDGQLDLVASHPDLAIIDLASEFRLSQQVGERSPRQFVDSHRRLLDSLSGAAFAHYDVVFIDCAPSYNVMTGNAIVASEYLLVPVQPDPFSYIGVHHLRRIVDHVVENYNRAVREVGRRSARKVVPPSLAVVFTMVTYWNNKPKQQPYISRLEERGVPTFSTLIRERPATYATAPEGGVPVICINRGRSDAAQELLKLVEEITKWIEGLRA